MNEKKEKCSPEELIKRKRIGIKVLPIYKVNTKEELKGNNFLNIRHFVMELMMEQTVESVKTAGVMFTIALLSAPENAVYIKSMLTLVDLFFRLCGKRFYFSRWHYKFISYMCDHFHKGQAYQIMFYLFNYIISCNNRKLLQYFQPLYRLKCLKQRYYADNLYFYIIDYLLEMNKFAIANYTYFLYKKEDLQNPDYRNRKLLLLKENKKYLVDVLEKLFFYAYPSKLKKNIKSLIRYFININFAIHNVYWDICLLYNFRNPIKVLPLINTAIKNLFHYHYFCEIKLKVLLLILYTYKKRNNKLIYNPIGKNKVSRVHNILQSKNQFHNLESTGANAQKETDLYEMIDLVVSSEWNTSDGGFESVLQKTDSSYKNISWSSRIFENWYTDQMRRERKRLQRRRLIEKNRKDGDDFVKGIKHIKKKKRTNEISFEVKYDDGKVLREKRTNTKVDEEEEEEEENEKEEDEDEMDGDKRNANIEEEDVLSVTVGSLMSDSDGTNESEDNNVKEKKKTVNENELSTTINKDMTKLSVGDFVNLYQSYAGPYKKYFASEEMSEQVDTLGMLENSISEERKEREEIAEVENINEKNKQDKKDENKIITAHAFNEESIDFKSNHLPPDTKIKKKEKTCIEKKRNSNKKKKQKQTKNRIKLKKNKHQHQHQQKNLQASENKKQRSQSKNLKDYNNVDYIVYEVFTTALKLMEESIYDTKYIKFFYFYMTPYLSFKRNAYVFLKFSSKCSVAMKPLICILFCNVYNCRSIIKFMKTIIQNKIWARQFRRTYFSLHLSVPISREHFIFYFFLSVFFFDDVLESLTYIYKLFYRNCKSLNTRADSSKNYVKKLHKRVIFEDPSKYKNVIPYIQIIINKFVRIYKKVFNINIQKYFDFYKIYVILANAYVSV